MNIVKDARWNWLRSLKVGDKVLVKGKGDEHIAVVAKIDSRGGFLIGNAQFDRYGRWGDDKVWKKIYPCPTT